MTKVYRVIAVNKTTKKERTTINVYKIRKHALEDIKEKKLEDVSIEEYKTHTFKIIAEIW